MSSLRQLMVANSNGSKPIELVQVSTVFPKVEKKLFESSFSFRDYVHNFT